MVAACYKGHAAVAELLLTGGADVDRALPSGATPLSIARENGHAAVVQLLLRARPSTTG